MSDLNTDVESGDGSVKPDEFHVSVTGAGISVTRKVDQLTALNVIATVMGGGAVASGSSPATAVPHNTPSPATTAPTSLQSANTGTQPQLDPRLTVGEYIEACEAQQYPAKITAIGHFLEIQRGAESFGRDEIKAQFRPAGEAPPANFPRDFSDAISRKWIAATHDDKDQYFVTNKGKEAIASKFDRALRKPSSSARRKRPTSKEVADKGITAQSPADDFQNLDSDL